MRSHHFKTPVLIAFTILCLSAAVEMAYAAPLQLKPTSLPDGTQYAVYAQTLTASKGTPPYFWSQTGTLPPGLTFTPSATTADISGIPTTAGTFPFTVTLTDSAGGSDPINYSIVITTGVCTFVGSNTGAISFGAIDPSSPGPIIYGAVGPQIQFTCPAGRAYTVAATPASGWTINSGANALPYTLGFITAGTGLGAAPIALLTTNSQILQTDYVNAAVGAHANTAAVDLTITWTAPGAGSITATLPINSVSATISPICAVFQSPGTLSFIINDPSAAGPVPATMSQDLLLKCTKNVNVTVFSASNCGGLSSAYPACGGSLIPYTFTFLSPVTGQGFGTGVPLNIGGSVNKTGYENAPVGSTYGDLQTLTISY